MVGVPQVCKISFADGLNERCWGEYKTDESVLLSAETWTKTCRDFFNTLSMLAVAGFSTIWHSLYRPFCRISSLPDQSPIRWPPRWLWCKWWVKISSFYQYFWLLIHCNCFLLLSNISFDTFLFCSITLCTDHTFLHFTQVKMLGELPLLLLVRCALHN
jgi:hypothetical protein